MSLLLLFNGGAVAVSTCFSVVATSTTTWTLVDLDFKNLWSEWATYTWAQLAASGYTWDYIAGYTFTVVNASSQTWTLTTVATCT